MTQDEERRFESGAGCAVSLDHGVHVLPRGVRQPMMLLDSAEQIWRLAMSGLVESEIAERISEAYGVPMDECLTTVTGFCEELMSRGVLAPDGLREKGEHVREGEGGLPPMNILIVCTGNICRSFFAERALRTKLGAREGVRISSAGTSAGHRHPVPAEVWAILENHGFDTSAHVPRRLNASLVAQADLVLTATVDHRRAVLEFEPMALRRTFTLLEAAAAAEAVQEFDAGTLPSLRNLASARSAIPSGTPLDIVDPFGQGAAEYERMAAVMLPAMESLCRFLAAE